MKGSVDLPVDVHTGAHFIRDIAVLIGVFSVLLWLLFRFASR
jgi:hypothetical protein